MKCGKCGRKLKNHKSQELGYGPTCYKAMCGSRNNKQIQYKERGHPLDNFSHYEVPGQISIDDYLRMISGQ